MSAREEFPKLHAETSGPHHQGETSRQAQAAMDRIDTLTAQRDEARTALVHLNRAERAAQGAMERGLRGPDDIAIIDLFDAVCKKAAGLVPADDWGLAPREEGKPHE